MRVPAGVVFLLLSSVVLFSSADPGSDDVDPPVSYRGFQLWSVTPQTEEQRLSLIKIRDDYGQCSVLLLFFSSKLYSFYV